MNPDTNSHIPIHDAPSYIPPQMPPLSQAEKQQLDCCETVIDRGWRTFVQVGEALTLIRNGRLYRQEFPSFEVYCREKWQYGKSQAYYLIGAARVMLHLSKTPDLPYPTHESQVRHLIGLTPDNIRRAWKRAVTLAPESAVTAKIVRQAALELSPPGRKPEQRTNPFAGDIRRTWDDIWQQLNEMENALDQGDPPELVGNHLRHLKGRLHQLDLEVKLSTQTKKLHADT